MGERPFELHEPAPERETPCSSRFPTQASRTAGVLAQIDVPASSLARDGRPLRSRALWRTAPLEGATLLYGSSPGTWSISTRAEDDIDADSVEGGPSGARAPRGVIWRLSGEGQRSSGPLSRARSSNGG